MSKSSAIDQIEIKNGLFLEASAGTGKTFTVAALVTRELALNDTLRIGEFLISTFTRNAAGELKDRVRRRIIDMADILTEGKPVNGDDLSEYLCGIDIARRNQMIVNLRRAAVEFDTATIGTIHSVCSRILTLAGLPSGNGEAAVSTKILVRQSVNDYVAADAIARANQNNSAIDGPLWDAQRLEGFVLARLSAPDAELWVDPENSIAAHLQKLANDVEKIVNNIHHASQVTPTFDDLLRRAAEVVNNSKYAVAIDSIRQKYRMAFVDEAQDTDPVQWSIFRQIIEFTSQDSYLVIVGDPKQSIYRFRGADVNAYIEQRDDKKLISLDTNYRSDEFMIDALNQLLKDKSFGIGINYVLVNSAPKNKGTKISGFQPVEIVNLGTKPSANAPLLAAALRVADILKNGKINGETVKLSDICVLVQANAIGQGVERKLRSMKIPAVSGGTASVMQSEAALSLRQLLQALERTSDMGRVRSAVASMFFGRSLLDPSIMANGRVDEESETHTDDDSDGARAESLVGIDVEHGFIRELAKALRKDGIAAVEAGLLGNPICLNSILRSNRAERRLTDLRHLVELIHQETNGRGIEPSDALQVLADFESLDATAELVSRRIESDVDAVKILTIHAAKGLEFPIVIVADLWKDKKATDNKDGNKTADDKTSKRPVLFLSPEPDSSGKRIRRIDIAWVENGIPTPIARLRAEVEAHDEMKRQFYVAVTRAQHHLSVLLPTEDGDENCVAYECINKETFEGEGALIPFVKVPASPQSPTLEPRILPEILEPFTASTAQTYRRTSFSGISEAAAGRLGKAAHIAPGSGLDERPDFFYGQVGSAPADIKTGAVMPLARVPKGTYIGTVIHTIFENFDSSNESLEDEISRLVLLHASGPTLINWHKELVDGLVLAAQTPLGPLMSQKSLASIFTTDRLPELSFEMGLAHLTKNVTVNHLGAVLTELLPRGDSLSGYAKQLCGPQFHVPLAGLINGSIDAVLRIRQENGSEQLFITDYKSNRLDTEDDAELIDAYRPDRLVHAMEHHHYPLQAILYGVAIHRFLRWKAPHLSSDEMIGGVAYFFLRGMVNDASRVDEHGCPYGVFQWQAPIGLWSRLSDVMAGVEHA